MALKTDKLEEGKTTTMKFSSQHKFTLLIALLITIIILLSIIIIVLTTTFNKTSKDTENQNDNKTDESSTTANEFQSTESANNGPQIPGSTHEMIYREKWGGKKPLYKRPQETPVKYVLISHTAGAFCASITACSRQITQIQTLHVTSGSPDIGYNFLIGGDANIYVGRGWDNHNFHMNLDTIGISFVGNYLFDQLTSEMIGATQDLLNQGMKEGKLDKDYILVPHNQTYNTQSPGVNVYKQIKFWPHFSSEYLEDIEKRR